MSTASARLLLAVSFLGLASARAAAAPDEDSDRTGFVIGFSVGFGATYPCDTCPSVAGSFYVGARTNRHVAVVADIGVTGGDFDRPFDERLSERGLALATFTLGVRVYPAERFWLMGGVGVGWPFENDWDEHHEFHDHDPSWAGVVGAGYEVLRKGRFSMDVQGRGAFAEGHQGVALGLGFNW
jgi:hypothetical protein